MAMRSKFTFETPGSLDVSISLVLVKHLLPKALILKWMLNLLTRLALLARPVFFTCLFKAQGQLVCKWMFDLLTRLALLAQPVFFTCLFKAQGQLVCKLAYASDTYGVS